MRIDGRLVLDDRLAPGSVEIDEGVIVSVELDVAHAGGPIVAPGYVDIHVHGWGGHDAMGPPGELDGMARSLLRHGVTSFVPTAVTAPLATLSRFADRVRGGMPIAAADGAEPLGFNLEGPFIALERKGAHDPDFIRAPSDVPAADLEDLLEGLRLITIAPETSGAPELIAWFRARGVVVALGHSVASLDESLSGYAAGARSTTHLFNAMTGVDHHAPGLAAAALAADDVYVELIADGHHVDRALWPIIFRTKAADRLILVSDAVALAGTGDGRGTIGAMEVEVRRGRCTMVSSGALAGSVIALDTAVQEVVRAGLALPAAVAAASRNPLALLGIGDRGRIAVGQRADLIELSDDLVVRRATRGDGWIEGGA